MDLRGDYVKNFKYIAEKLNFANNSQEDSAVILPEVLQEFVGVEKIGLTA
jgi:hypothetical protein